VVALCTAQCKVLLFYYYKRHAPGYVAPHSQLASEAMAVSLLNKKILAVRRFSASEMLNCTPRSLKMVMEHMNGTGLSVTIILLVCIIPTSRVYQLLEQQLLCIDPECNCKLRVVTVGNNIILFNIPSSHANILKKKHGTKSYRCMFAGSRICCRSINPHFLELNFINVSGRHT